MYNEEEHIESEFMKQHRSNPFRVPGGYFDSFDDRIMNRIQAESKTKTRTVRFVSALKPALAIAASILVVYLVANIQFAKNNVSRELSSGTVSVAKDDSTLNFSLIDESTLVNAIFSDEKSSAEEINPDDMLAYLSSGLNDVQIYSAIQNSSK